MINKKPILQKHNFGCGVSCVAFVLGLNYLVALKLFKNSNHRANNTGFYCKEIVEILKNKGRFLKYKYIKNKTRRNIYQNYSIVFIKRSKKYPSGHYLCRYKNMWMDPWINFQKNKDIKKAKTGFRKRLPDKPIYVIFS